MGIKNNVFGSKSEQRNYYKLSRTWGDKYRIYHNLPFLSIFTVQGLYDFSNMQPLKLTEIDISRLKKTSVDFTLCDDNDSPILCIEFDGLQEGFNIGDTYYPTVKSQRQDPWRKIIIELKLKVAFGSFFPFIVVASKQFDDLTKDVKLTLVDGIIGDILARRDTLQKISNGFNPNDVGYSNDDFEELSEIEQHAIIQDWVLGIEVGAEFEHNPITRKCAEMQEELGIHSFSVHYVCFPSDDVAKTFEERILLRENAIYKGAKIKFKTLDLGDVEGIALIPNFESFGFSGGLVLAEEIAKIFALQRIKNLRVNAAQNKNGSNPAR